MIRYTLDGAPPSRTVGMPIANGAVVAIPATATLKAIAYREDGAWADSTVTSAPYTVR